jgi:tripartite-type tricarboxylate transporter receptor subunit TctC
MSIARRLLLTAGAATLSAPAAHAQEYPTRAVRVIVPYAAGGTDQYVRLLQQDIAQALGQPVLIDSVIGGGGGVGANRVRTSAPDGYTLLFAGTAALTVVPRMQNLPYTSTDFAPICNIVAIPIMVAARRNAPFRTLLEMLAQARAQPESITFGSPGNGSSPHLAGEVMARAAGVKLLHVPYPGIAPAMTALLAGQIDLVVGAPGIVMPAAEAHGIIPLAQTGATRIAALPDLVSLRDVGLDVDLVTRFAFFAPKQTSDAVIDKLERSFLGAAGAPTYAQAMRRAYNEVVLLDRARLAVALAEEDQVSARLVRELGLG